MARAARRARSGGELGVISAVLVVMFLSTSVLWYRAHNVRVPLLAAGVGIGADGRLETLSPAQRPSTVFIGLSRALASDPLAEEAADRQERWLAAGSVPGAGTEYGDMVRLALLDLKTLTLPNCASLAGWPQPWRYVWPRDASFVAVAFARSGHQDEARCVLRFLQQIQPASGVFEARYRPDGAGPPDGRGVQSDSVGWVLWAVDQVRRSLPEAGHQRQDLLVSLRPLITRSASAALALTDTGSGLPPAGMDYWEVHDSRLSLGTAAPVAAGLAASPPLLRAVGDSSSARAAEVRAAKVSRAIKREFGVQGYPRYLGQDEHDASLAFLLPPFTDVADQGVVSTWRRALPTMERPAGGLAPGSGWKNDGISWTPQTALAGLTAAYQGDLATARARLLWLAAHRTALGAIPEKVLSNGRPAGPAPLAWSDALVVLTAAEIERSGASNTH
jgi:glucoamylase